MQQQTSDVGKQVVYVYSRERALELIEKEGPRVEVHCVRNQKAVCRSPAEVLAFYNSEVPNHEAEPE